MSIYIFSSIFCKRITFINNNKNQNKNENNYILTLYKKYKKIWIHWMHHNLHQCWQYKHKLVNNLRRRVPRSYRHFSIRVVRWWWDHVQAHRCALLARHRCWCHQERHALAHHRHRAHHNYIRRNHRRHNRICIHNRMVQVLEVSEIYMQFKLTKNR